MNSITSDLSTGTLGELLVQIRLLQYGVQAAPAIKDSGNDLIAVNGAEFRAVSVRTTTNGKFNKPAADRTYHILAVVDLAIDAENVYLDKSKLYLLPFGAVKNAPFGCHNLGDFEFSRDMVEHLFGPLPA